MGVLDGRVSIVTGAGSGLGRAVADELAKAGAIVVVAELDAGAGERAAAEIGPPARFTPIDVTSSAAVDAAFDSVVRDLGSLDIVVNNAGISRVGPHTKDVTDKDWLDSVAVLQTGVFYCMRAAARHMLPRGAGSVVNISSIRSFSPNRGRMSYCAPKAAVNMMTRIAAAEWGPHGVRCNAVAPGPLRTPMWEEDVARGALDEGEFLRVIPAGRLGVPAEVGELIVYLCSDAASYITGAIVTIDGGLTTVPGA